MKVVHSRLQHGVGQGSFHSASVEVHGDGPGSHHRFDYVYDCGALSGRAMSPALSRSMDRMDVCAREGSGGRAVLDALVLSHFDRDHIIGASHLVRKCEVKRIFVPYLSPPELALVLASQADGLEAGHIGGLHGLAHGAASLFDVPVTLVQAGGGADDAPVPVDPDGPAPGPATTEATEAAARPGLPRSLEALDDRTGRPVDAVMPASHGVALAVPGLGAAKAPWRLRFWNRGTDDDLLAHLFEALVMCDFPIAALHDPGGGAEVVDWLEDSANRAAAVQAYRAAIAAHQPAWAAEASGTRLANFLSLGLYSGPAPHQHRIHRYRVLDTTGRGTPTCDLYCNWNYLHAVEQDGRVGWLGTGDAPLGEKHVWADFSAHYADALGSVLTVQVPHHGAAPLGGPRFFNRELLPVPGMHAVVSVGTRNTYGHPRAAVLKDVLAEGGRLAIVTEAHRTGFHELLVLRMP